MDLISVFARLLAVEVLWSAAVNHRLESKDVHVAELLTPL